MIPVQLATSVAQTAMGLGQSVAGIFQRAKANRDARKNIRPVYTVPKEIDQNVALAARRAATGLPTEQYLKSQQNINRNTAGAISMLQDRRSALAGISQIAQRQNDAQLGLDVADANARVAAEGRLMDARNAAARYADRAWEWNSKQNYLEKAADIRARQTAGNANLNAGLNAMGSGAAEYLSSIKKKEPIENTGGGAIINQYGIPVALGTGFRRMPNPMFKSSYGLSR